MKFEIFAQLKCYFIEIFFENFPTLFYLFLISFTAKVRLKEGSIEKLKKGKNYENKVEW